MLSFMGSIGVIMAGSGLEEMWETVCAKNSVVHMMNGRAYVRGIRAHFISQSALATLLLGSSTADDSLKKDVETCFVSLLDNSATLEDIEHSNALHDIEDLLSTRLPEVCSSGRTDKLWVQYFKLVAIIRLFIRAERCGDWQLQVHTVWHMIPYLHAAGHLHYARSAQVYLQEMLNLADIPNLVEPAAPVSASVTSSRIYGQWCYGERSCQLRRCSVRWRSVSEGYGREAVQ